VEGFHKDLKNTFHEAVCEYMRNNGIPIKSTLKPTSSVKGDVPSWKKRIKLL